MKPRNLLLFFLLSAILVPVLPAIAKEAQSTSPQRVNNTSPWFSVDDRDIDLLMNYTGVRNGEPFAHLEIGDEAIRMIHEADRYIVASVFLFDSFYAEGVTPIRDIVTELTDLLVAKRKQNPDLVIAVILDPSHKAYGRRVSPSERAFREAGIDVFYSDLLDDLKRASFFGVRETSGHVGRLVDKIPIIGNDEVQDVVFSPARIKTPKKIDDEIRIQMFYLSYKPVVDAIIRASRTVDTPIRIILDANKDSFNTEKDGTPNRQVAHYLLKKTRRASNPIQVRWYNTHGEQNHAKTLSISNPDPDRCWFIAGSCNWTGRNMAGVNMEADLIVRGSARINAEFATLFDRIWSNEDAEYTLDYEAFKKHAGYWKWKKGEKPFFYSTF